MPFQMLVGDELARWVYNNEPVKFAAIEMVPKTSSDVPETLFGYLNSSGQVEGGIPIPGLASWLSDPADGTSTVSAPFQRASACGNGDSGESVASRSATASASSR